MFEIEIKIGGAVIPDDIEIREVIVDQHSHLPHMFTIILDDYLDLTTHEFQIDQTIFDMTKEVEISASPNSEYEGEVGVKTTLIKGEITAVEHDFDQGLRHIIRGYDKSHRLFRESKSQAFLNIKDSDLATQFAGNAGLTAQVDATSTVYEHLYQDNQTDLAFLTQRAWRIGYECFVDEGKLYFRKPPTGNAAVTLTYSENIISCSFSSTLAEQVDSVEVKGWDPKTLKVILGISEKGTLYPKNGDTKDGGKWAHTFGAGKHTLVDIPVVSQAEADKIAEARLNELSGAYVTAEIVTLGIPTMKAGQFVKIENVGTRLSGSYMVTNAKHIFRAGDYITSLSVSGARTGLLSEQLSHQEPVKRWPGVVTAVVTNSDDPSKWGRVKVKYPWMAEDAESFWARLSGPGAGPTAGLIAIPAVGDEVVVAFEYGDINFPVIIGGLWNGKHKIPPAAEGAADGERPLVRSWHSINGHTIDMYDNADKKIEMMTIDGHLFVMDDTNKKIEIKTSGGHTALIDDQNKKIEIKSSGGHTITLDDNGRKVIVKSSGDVEIQSATNMKIQSGANLELIATGNLDIKSTGPANIQTSAIMAIKGSLVQIN